MRPPDEAPRFVDADYRPRGPLWRRLLEALKIAIENIRVRRTEGAGDGVHLYDDLDDLATKDDRKGDRP